MVDADRGSEVDGQGAGGAGLRRFVELRDRLASGGWWDGADEALSLAAETALVEALAALPEDAAAVAIGGFGRGSLALGSDVDLLLLTPGTLPEDEVARWLEPFGEAGVRVAWAAHTPASARTLAGSRLDGISLFLTARPIVGDRAVFEAFWSRFVLLLDREYGRIVEAMAREEARRREEDPYRALAVDLKNGRGGLRTLDMLDWRRRLGEAVGLPASSPSRAETEARAFLTVLRSALHAVAGPTDRLTTGRVAAVARLVDLAPERLTARRLELARTAERLVDGIWPEVARLLLDPGRRPLPEPDSASIAAAIRHARRPDRHPLPPAGLPGTWTEADREAFLALLGPDLRPVFDRLLASGWVASVFPEFDRLFLTAGRGGCRTPWTVGGHTLAVLDALAAMDAAGQAPAVSLPWAPRRLRWAAVLHDIAVPVSGGGDGAASADLVRDVLARRLGFDREAGGLVERLVRHHRALLEPAVRRAPPDVSTVRAVAAGIGDLATLRLLHSLTVADVRAGGGPRPRVEERVRRAYRAVERELWRSG